MKLKVLLGVVILSQTVTAQSFTEVMGTPFEGVASSSVAFSDVDSDGDDDVLITGLNGSDERITKLYTNDGGTFTELMATPFEGVTSGSVSFSDVDGDGDDDVLITGLNGSDDRIAKLYTNDGGNFTEVMGTPFAPVSQSSASFSDVDGDGDDDLLITGENDTEGRIAKLYTNDGGSFNEVMGTPFDGVYFGSIAFSDVDGDGDKDVLITGEYETFFPTAKLYTNDAGIFNEVIGTPFVGVWLSSIAFSDVDGDGANDLLITGSNDSNEPIAKLYTNAGGIFTEVTDTPFNGVFISSMAFSDVDGDGDDDVLITGLSTAGRIAKLYTNEGGSFTETMWMSFDGVYNSFIAFSDIDGDGDNDVLITGVNGSDERIAKLYTNDGSPNSIDESTLGADLTLVPYPNPTNSALLNLSFDSPASGFSSISIYDVQGRLLHQQREFVAMGEQTISVDIASLLPGSYFIKMDNGNENGVAKFVVE